MKGHKDTSPISYSYKLVLKEIATIISPPCSGVKNMLTRSAALCGSLVGASLERLRGLQGGLWSSRKHVASPAGPGVGQAVWQVAETRGVSLPEDLYHVHIRCMWIHLRKSAFYLFKKNLFLALPQGLQDVRSPTRDRTPGPPQ